MHAGQGPGAVRAGRPGSSSSIGARASSATRRECAEVRRVARVDSRLAGPRGRQRRRLSRLAGLGGRSAATVLARYEHLEQIPKLATGVGRVGARSGGLATTLVEQTSARCCSRLATLRADAPIGVDVDALRCGGPRAPSPGGVGRLGAPPLRPRGGRWRPRALFSPRTLTRADTVDGYAADNGELRGGASTLQSEPNTRGSIQLGVFQPAEPIELIGGELMVAEPQGAAHYTAIRKTVKALEAAFGRGWEVRMQGPIGLDDDSEPGPDVAVVPASGRLWPRPSLVARSSPSRWLSRASASIGGTRAISTLARACWTTGCPT